FGDDSLRRNVPTHLPLPRRGNAIRAGRTGGAGVAFVWREGTESQPAVSDTFTVAGVTGRLVNAPPVYDPGGPVCLVTTLPDDTNAVALALAEHEAKERGAVLIVVNCPHGGSHESVLAAAGYQIASSWYTGPTHSGEGTAAGVRHATSAD